jgi:hypothetical protein
MTNTKVKLVVVLQDCSQDVNMKQWLRDLHTLYIATVCNPFSDMHSAIQNPTFEQNIHKLVKNWSVTTRAHTPTLALAAVAERRARCTSLASGLRSASGLREISRCSLGVNLNCVCVVHRRFYVERK